MTLLLGNGGERGRGRRNGLVPVSDGDLSTRRMRVGGRESERGGRLTEFLEGV